MSTDRPPYDRRRARYEDDDERGSYFRSRDPYEPREWRARESLEPDYPAHYEGDFGGREERFGQFEDWERPRELPPQRSFRRPFGVTGAASFRRRERSTPRFESPGGYSGLGPKGYQRSDERLKENVCDALTTDPDIDASEIEVSVQNAEVTLEGSVRERQMKRDAEDCVEAIPGVQQVHNRIRVAWRGPH
jgi:hypothetical protein